MIKTEKIPYMDQETTLEGYAAYREANKRQPLVLLCHAWRGRDDFICEKAELIAQWGYVGFALDMYGKGILGKSKEENAALKKPFNEDRLFLQKRLLKGFETACSLPYVDTTRIVVLGFGFGGMCALDLARSGVPLIGAISVYGHFDPPRNTPIHPINTKILVLHGFNDPISPMQDLLAFEKELHSAGVDWQVHLYGDTFHAFAAPSANDPASGILCNPLSANRAWQAIRNFLDESLN